MTEKEARDVLLDERNANISGWIGSLPTEYWFGVAAKHRAEVARLTAENERTLSALRSERDFVSKLQHLVGELRAAIARLKIVDVDGTVVHQARWNAMLGEVARLTEALAAEREFVVYVVYQAAMSVTGDATDSHAIRDEFIRRAAHERQEGEPT